jgi:hypothetical protein
MPPNKSHPRNDSCGYGRTPDSKSVTCFTSDELKLFLEETKPGNRIPKSKNKRYSVLLKLLGVENDDGIIEKLTLDPNVYKKPPMPELLLSNEDISFILKQYEVAHPSFKSFGSVPYDFLDSPPGPWNSLCNELNSLDWNDFLKNHSSFGMVINLDVHTKPGNHWVCIYTEVSKSNKQLRLEYFDSLGTKRCRLFIKKCNDENVPYRIHELFEILSDKFKMVGKKQKVTVSQNIDTHQKKNNECGMYCLYYIFNRINEVEYKDGVHTIPDDKMTYFRNILFDHTGSLCKTCGKVPMSLLTDIETYGSKSTSKNKM